MSKLEAKAQERNESCDPSSQNVQDTQIGQNTEDKDAKVAVEKDQKPSCGSNSTAGIERWGVKTGGREWAEND